MPLHDNGYLGRHNQEWSKAHQEKHKEVFGHLREVNRLCHEYLREHAVNPKNGPQVFATTYFSRGLTCFQSIVALAERGLIDDVRALCRTLLQVNFRPKANKGAVVEWLSEYLKIPSAEIVTIGDMPNDVLMFQKSRYSIAMGQASDEVKPQPPVPWQVPAGPFLPKGAAKCGHCSAAMAVAVGRFPGSGRKCRPQSREETRELMAHP
jgi:hydroxymethylpyrimidine pyrophosphatase-like HAD family hydrolase